MRAPLSEVYRNRAGHLSWAVAATAAMATLDHPAMRDSLLHWALLAHAIQAMADEGIHWATTALCCSPPPDSLISIERTMVLLPFPRCRFPLRKQHSTEVGSTGLAAASRLVACTVLWVSEYVLLMRTI
jgi:hypothetical protein